MEGIIASGDVITEGVLNPNSAEACKLWYSERDDMNEDSPFAMAANVDVCDGVDYNKDCGVRINLAV